MGDPMLRTSSYTIYVDLPDNKDEMLLVHSYTGAFDRVSRRVATYVRSLEEGRPPKPLYGDWTAEKPPNGDVSLPSDEVVALLKKRGYLTSLPRDKEEHFFKTLVEKIHERQQQAPPSYLFMPNYDCNLRCPYCFQDHMRTDPAFQHLLRRMDRSMVDRIFEAMPRIEALQGVPEDYDWTPDIGFFGGEPLLASNREIISYIMDRANDRRPSTFWAISNGTELEAYRDVIGPDQGMIRSIQITLDGPPDAHDDRRIYPDGSGSWDRIAENISWALDSGAVIAIRTNVDRSNLEGLPRLAAEMKANGWHEYSNFATQVAPIRASNEKTSKKTTLNAWQLDKALTEMRISDPDTAILGRLDDSTRSQAQRIFGGTSAPRLKPSFCAAHVGMYIFDAFGDIYACWEKTGDSKVRIGHVDEGGALTLNAPTNDLWRQRTVASNPVCTKCRYAMYCGGGCAVLALESQGEYYRNYCDGFAHRFRAAVADAYQDHLAGRSVGLGQDAFCDM